MILIAPYSKQLSNGKTNPKNYPFWKEVIEGIDEPIIQVGIEGEEQLTNDFRKNLPISEIQKLIDECRVWISCDSFIQHLASLSGKRGIVLWSVSDPKIYGYAENVNLLKSRDCLSKNQFLWWESVDFDASKFVGYDQVIYNINTFKPPKLLA